MKGFLLHGILCKIGEGFAFPKVLTESLVKLKKNKDLVITKADKGNNIVIMDKADYMEKMEALLADEETYQQIRGDPLKKEQQKFNNKLKEILGLKHEFMNRFISRLPRLAYMYGLPKTHKIGVPCRPIISNIGTVSYNLSKWLAGHLSALVGTISSSHVRNSEEFVNRIRNIDLRGKKMVSFDVVSLFTKVPLELTLEFLEEHLQRKKIELQLGNKIFLKLLRLAVSVNIFGFNGKYYRQIFGLAMGNPLSPVLSNLFMEFFEERFLRRTMNTDITWIRYVDDCFIVVPEDFDIESYLEEINHLMDSVKFTCEAEVDGVLPFLDVAVSRGIDGRPVFRVFRKKTNNENYIHCFSAHEEHVKMGVLVGLVLRGLRICSMECFDEEVEHLRKVFKKLGYSEKFMEKGIRKGKKIFYGEKKKREKKCCLVVPGMVDVEMDGLLPEEVRLVTGGGVLTSQLVRTKHHELDGNAGIYLVGCKDCDDIYIGESADIGRRLYQHEYALRKEDKNSALVRHRRRVGHNFDVSEKNGTLLRIEDDFKRRLLESLLIRETDNINSLETTHDIDWVSAFLLKNTEVFSRLKKSLLKVKEEWKLPGD